jgi:hypothetical protein
MRAKERSGPGISMVGPGCAAGPVGAAGRAVGFQVSGRRGAIAGDEIEQDQPPRDARALFPLCGVLEQGFRLFVCRLGAGLAIAVEEFGVAHSRGGVVGRGAGSALVQRAGAHGIAALLEGLGPAQGVQVGAATRKSQERDKDG